MPRLREGEVDAGIANVQDPGTTRSVRRESSAQSHGEIIALIADHSPEAPPDDGHDAYDIEPSTVLRRARRPRRNNTVARAALGGAALVVTVVLALAGVGFAYLGRGPISLESLQPAIAANLQSRLAPGYSVALGPTAIMRGPHGVGIGFGGLTIKDPQGRAVVSAPGGRIGLDAFALLRLDVKVRRLELDGLQLALRVDANGDLSLSAGAENSVPIPIGRTPAAPAQNNFGALVAAVAEAMAGADQPLDHVAIVDGRLTVQTAGRPAAAVYDSLRLTFDRSGATAKAALSAKGPSGDWSVEASAEGGADRKLSLEARQLAVDDFMRLAPNPPAFSFDSPISFHFTAQSTPSGALTALDGAFSLGAGSFDPHDPDSGGPIAIDEATGLISLDPQGRYKLDRVEALAGQTHVRFAGLVEPPLAADPQWRVRLHSGDIVFAGARASEPAAKLDDVDLVAHYDVDAKTFEIDKFTLRGPRLSGDFYARVHMSDAGAETKLDLAGAGSLMEALRLWPTFINPDARKWCQESLRAGELASGSFKADWDAAAFAAVMRKQAPPADSVDGRFTVRNVAAVLLPGLPVTSGLDASGTITGRHFEVAATHGVMDLSGGRRILGTDLSFVVPDTKPVDRMPAQGQGHVLGGADALADLLSLDALKKYVGVTLDPNAIRGQFQGDLKLDLTLGKGVRPEEQKFRANGSLSGLAVDKFLGNSKLEQGAIDFSSDPNQIKMSGTGQVFGAPAKLDVTKIGQEVGALTVTSTLDEAARTKLNFNSGPRLRGPVVLKLKAPLDKSGADVEIDLAKASLDSLGGPPWKTAGKPGKATFTVKPTADGVQVANLVIDAGSLSARGSALFASEGALKWLKLSPIRMGAGDDLKLDLEGGERPKLTLRGASLDARGIVKGLTGGEGEGESRELELDVKIGAAIGNNKEQIAPFEMTGVRRNGGFASLDARGKIGQGAVSAHSGEGGLIVIKSDDAGALARFLDVYGKMEGGAIDLSVRQVGDTARGVATIRKFAIRDEASLKQLEQAAPPRSNLPRGGNLFGGGDGSPPVRFDKLTASFTRNGGKLEVRDGVVANVSFGLTTQGFIDFSHDKVDLNGVFVPLYQFNNALGGIPLLGQLLTGGQNEGVFAINYRVTGAASSPSLNVNPLSGMTPGFLRKMFGAIDGTTPPTPDDLPASSYAPAAPNR